MVVEVSQQIEFLCRDLDSISELEGTQPEVEQSPGCQQPLLPGGHQQKQPLPPVPRLAWGNSGASGSGDFVPIPDQHPSGQSVAPELAGQGVTGGAYPSLHPQASVEEFTQPPQHQHPPGAPPWQGPAPPPAPPPQRTMADNALQAGVVGASQATFGPSADGNQQTASSAVPTSSPGFLDKVKAVAGAALPTLKKAAEALGRLEGVQHTENE